MDGDPIEETRAERERVAIYEPRFQFEGRPISHRLRAGRHTHQCVCVSVHTLREQIEKVVTYRAAAADAEVLIVFSQEREAPLPPKRLSTESKSTV